MLFFVAVAALVLALALLVRRSPSVRYSFIEGLTLIPVATREDAWKALEDAHAEECRQYLTAEDVEWLKWWDWTPTPAVQERMDAARRAKRAAQLQEEEQTRLAAMSPDERAAYLRSRRALARIGGYRPYV